MDGAEERPEADPSMVEFDGGKMGTLAGWLDGLHCGMASSQRKAALERQTQVNAAILEQGRRLDPLFGQMKRVTFDSRCAHRYAYEDTSWLLPMSKKSQVALSMNDCELRVPISSATTQDVQAATASAAARATSVSARPTTLLDFLQENGVPDQLRKELQYPYDVELDFVRLEGQRSDSRDATSKKSSPAMSKSKSKGEGGRGATTAAEDKSDDEAAEYRRAKQDIRRETGVVIPVPEGIDSCNPGLRNSSRGFGRSVLAQIRSPDNDLEDFDVLRRREDVRRRTVGTLMVFLGGTYKTPGDLLFSVSDRRTELPLQDPDDTKFFLPKGGLDGGGLPVRPDSDDEEAMEE